MKTLRADVSFLVQDMKPGGAAEDPISGNRAGTQRRTSTALSTQEELADDQRGGGQLEAVRSPA